MKPDEITVRLNPSAAESRQHSGTETVKIHVGESITHKLDSAQGKIEGVDHFVGRPSEVGAIVLFENRRRRRIPIRRICFEKLHGNQRPVKRSVPPGIVRTSDFGHPFKAEMYHYTRPTPIRSSSGSFFPYVSLLTVLFIIQEKLGPVKKKGNRPINPRPHKTDSPTVSARKPAGQMQFAESPRENNRPGR